MAQFDGALEMRGHVTLAVTGSSKTEIAVRAFEGFGPGVEAHVDLETAAGSEEGTADVAANVFGRRVVSPRVRVQRGLDRKGFAAKVAFIRLLSRVDATMPGEE